MKNLLNKKQGLIFLFLIMSIVLCAQGKFTVDRDKIDEMLRQKKVTTTTQTSTTKPVQKATSRPTTPVNKVVSNGNGYTVTINGVTFKMVNVQGGTFTMGATSEQGSEADSDEKPTHSLTLSSFSIGETEVTQALWQVVMGESVTQIASRNGLSTYGVGSNYPMYEISWNDCQEFIRKLNNLLSSQLGGKRFRMPTEAEWEFAARGGNKSNGYKYSGSNNIDDVAWYMDKSATNGTKQTHPVKQKQPNELGIYDMSGNVWEWCQDWYGNYSSSSKTNPTGPSSGSNRVYRGGSWFNNARYCRSSCRSINSPNDKSYNLGLRLALSDDDSMSNSSNQIQKTPTTISSSPSSYSSPSSSSTSSNKQTFTANGVPFTMVYVQGDTFTMGATPEQGSDAYDDEKPAHSVTLSSFSIGETEVTQALWLAVMGSAPTYNGGWETQYGKGSNYPAYRVSWNDCQEFIRRLNNLTGKNFRLPTEAEWEFAARGGNKSKGYKYCGSNFLGGVAWYNDNSAINGTRQSHPVKQKQANELGIYDMSGNVYEWCSDRYSSSYYGSSPSNNPKGPSSGPNRVYRGGSWGNYAKDCRSSSRYNSNPNDSFNVLGLRLALSE